MLSGSKSRIESLSIESLFNMDVVKEFLGGKKNIEDLPEIMVEVYLEDINKPEINGKQNSLGGSFDGLKLICKPNDELSREIKKVLESPDNFTFEFYSIFFYTFSGEAFSSYSRFLKYLSLDNTQINTAYANSKYINLIYRSMTDFTDRINLENKYRMSKEKFASTELGDVSEKLDEYKFSIKSNTNFNLESDLTILDNGISIENKGKGAQSFIKAEFALRNKDDKDKLDILLLEEPENHLSHTNMLKLIHKIQKSHTNQIIIATHSSLISSRLDLRNALLLNSSSCSIGALKKLTTETADFFMKAPNHNILEFVLSKKVILVEGDSEYILLPSLYEEYTGRSIINDEIHIISVGGTSFKRYLELSRIV